MFLVTNENMGLCLYMENMCQNIWLFNSTNGVIYELYTYLLKKVVIHPYRFSLKNPSYATANSQAFQTDFNQYLHQLVLKIKSTVLQPFIQGPILLNILHL